MYQDLDDGDDGWAIPRLRLPTLAKALVEPRVTNGSVFDKAPAEELTRFYGPFSDKDL